MIRSWKKDAACRLFEQQKSSVFRGLDVNAAIDLLLALNVARGLDDLQSLHTARLKKQKGGKKKRWTLTIDDRWQIRFDLRKGNAHDVRIAGQPGGKLKTDKKKHAGAITPAVHPGRLLRRELGARKLSANRLALDLGVPSGRIIDILNARRAISADTAVRIGRYLGISAQFWCDLQSQFDIAVVERKKGAEIAKRVRAAKAD